MGGDEMKVLSTKIIGNFGITRWDWYLGRYISIEVGLWCHGKCPMYKWSDVSWVWV